MYEMHLTDADGSDILGIRLRRSGREIIDTITIQLPDGELYGFLTRQMESDTIAEEAIQSGADAILDIDAGRVDSSGDHKRQYQPTNQDRNIYGEQDGFQPTNADGRFPTNTIFVHAGSCEVVGTKKVKGSISVNKNREGEMPNDVYGTYGTDLPDEQGYANADGKEKVEDWDCHKNCLVETLDQQSGILETGDIQPHDNQGPTFQLSGEITSSHEGDSGGASRYYFQAASSEEAAQYLQQLIGNLPDFPEREGAREEPPFFYTSKASSGERDRGCGDLYWKWEDDGWAEIEEEEYRAFEKLREALRNDEDPPESLPVDPTEYDTVRDLPRTKNGSPHPTVKPIRLMEWLVGRLCEPGDDILDPFAGTGTTAIGALKEGHNTHLVELDEKDNYHQVIHGRLEAARKVIIAETPVWEEPPEIEFSWDTEEDEFDGFEDHWG